jgi:hypothetical protein
VQVEAGEGESLGGLAQKSLSSVAAFARVTLGLATADVACCPCLGCRLVLVALPANSLEVGVRMIVACNDVVNLVRGGITFAAVTLHNLATVASITQYADAP